MDTNHQRGDHDQYCSEQVVTAFPVQSHANPSSFIRTATLVVRRNSTLRYRKQAGFSPIFEKTSKLLFLINNIRFSRNKMKAAAFGHGQWQSAIAP
jgi:hypothetical protein